VNKKANSPKIDFDPFTVMNTTFAELETTLLEELHPHAHCHVVFLYEDYESGWHAMRIYEDLVRANCTDCLADWNRWRFADLLNPEARAAAIESLQGADMVILAAPETAELTVEAQAALETGVGLDHEEDRAFVALLGVHSERKPLSSPLYFYLQDLAVRNGFSFFKGTFLLPKGEDYSVDSIRERAETRGAVLGTILNRQLPLHWGINE
jgi:hypothetical protein